jgi:hypothetical protein
MIRRCDEPPTSPAIYGYGKFELQHCVSNAHRPAVAELERQAATHLITTDFVVSSGANRAS